MDAHKERRDIIGAPEKRLADDLTQAGYDVMNTVNCSWPIDDDLYSQVRAAFAEHFPEIGSA